MRQDRGWTETVQLAAMITLSKLITCIVLTLPVVPRDRWFICCVIGPIMLAGCMDIVWSMVGVITAPWWRRRKRWMAKERNGVWLMLHNSHHNISGTPPNTGAAPRSRPMENPTVIPYSIIHHMLFTVLWNIGDSGEHMSTSLYVADSVCTWVNNAAAVSECAHICPLLVTFLWASTGKSNMQTQTGSLVLAVFSIAKKTSCSSFAHPSHSSNAPWMWSFLEIP